jgi:hypothetical protein
LDTAGWAFFMFAHPVSMTDVDELLLDTGFDRSDLEITLLHDKIGIIYTTSTELALLMRFRLLP